MGRAREPRHEVTITVDYASKDVFLAGRVTNISRGGLFIASDTPLPIDAEVAITLTLPDLGIGMNAKGRVAWNYDIRKGSPRLLTGSGIRFTEISPDDRMILEAYLEMLSRSARESLAR
jgi:uncharacterized protein (TIGR02266 family)